ncbi:conjugative transfer signal peptidase TraF [Agrobacterium tumefaciens]|uniref:conjugative transfer signal peptidase TraF n=1 Tax=Agrobacterium tumefaciens TaxID=358 RepID=UPI0022442013|nr:conjugative transfer signal peptidase TraF [Agrobacterium tumefaciens]MCW8060161.1 conjugative transfer signal peptidase TraF [Agrobacterium tumefaciens]
MTARRNALVILGAGAVLLAGIASTFAFGGYRINFTPSYNLGLWQIVALDRGVRAGDRIFICPPDGEAVELALERHYLPRGLCASGSGPLIKTVAATAGQSVEIGDQVIIDGRPLHSSRVLKADAEGRPMPVYAGGTIPEGTVFLHSEFVGSYDSRYFGPLPTTGTLGLAREVLTYAP